MTITIVVYALQDILSGVNVIDVVVDVVSGLGMMMSLPKSILSITSVAARDDNNNIMLLRNVLSAYVIQRHHDVDKTQQKYLASVA